jgi:hypothetical protein
MAVKHVDKVSMSLMNFCHHLVPDSTLQDPDAFRVLCFRQGQCPYARAAVQIIARHIEQDNNPAGGPYFLILSPT